MRRTFHSQLFFFLLNFYAVHDDCFKGFRRYVLVSSVPQWARSRCHALTAPTWRSCPTGIEDGPDSFYEGKETWFHVPHYSVSVFLTHADNLSVQLPSWGLLWITLWTHPVAASVQ